MKRGRFWEKCIFPAPLFALISPYCWGFLYVLFHLAFYLALLYCSACEDEVFGQESSLYCILWKHLLKYRNVSIYCEIERFFRMHIHMITFGKIHAHSCTHFSLNSQIKYRLREERERVKFILFEVQQNASERSKKNR